MDIKKVVYLTQQEWYDLRDAGTLDPDVIYLTPTDNYGGVIGEKGPEGDKGDTGDRGDSGADAYTIMITPDSYVFPGDEKSALNRTMELSVKVYKGKTQIATNIITVSGANPGMTTTVRNNLSMSTTIEVVATSLLTDRSGILSIPIRLDDTTVFTKYFSWALALTGAKGSPGSQGPKGDTGATGPRGLRGIPGASGTLYDVIIRTQAEFEALYNSPDWLGATSVAFVGGITPHTTKLTTPIVVNDTGWAIESQASDLDFTEEMKDYKYLIYKMDSDTSYCKFYMRGGGGLDSNGRELSMTRIGESNYFYADTRDDAFNGVSTAAGWVQFGAYANTSVSGIWLSDKADIPPAQINENEPMKFTRSDGLGLKVPQTVKRIDGFNNAIIEITEFDINTETNKGGLWYDVDWSELPTKDKYSISGLTVICTGALEVGSKRAALDGYAFVNCKNLTNCIGHGHNINVWMNGYGNYGYGFVDCDNLTNCTGHGESVYGWGIGFRGCDGLLNCRASAFNGTTSYSTYVSSFYQCRNLSGCDCQISAIGSGAIVYGFYQCDLLDRCSGEVSGLGSGSSGSHKPTYCYYSCNQLNNCVGVVSSENASNGMGFSNCKKLSGCDAIVTCSGGSSWSIGAAVGFWSCNQLDNCTATVIGETNTTTEGYGNGFGFWSCNQLSNCTAMAKATSKSKTHSGSAIGFRLCTQLTNCIASGSALGVAGVGYCFSDCNFANGCKEGKDLSSDGIWHGANTFVDEYSCQMNRNDTGKRLSVEILP